MNLDAILNSAVAAAMPWMIDRVDIEQQGSTAGTGSDTPGWTVLVSEWNCFQQKETEGPGTREAADGGAARAFTYRFIGPAVHDDGTPLIGVVKQGMRLRVAARDDVGKPEQVFIVDDAGSDAGVILTINARLPE